MKLEEAIEIGVFYEQDLMMCLPTAKRIAIERLIGAGKAIIAWRNLEDNVDLMLLPGETI